MFISDLEHLEVLQEENQVKGGEQFIAISSGAGSGLATSGSVSLNSSSNANAFDYQYYYGSSRGASAGTYVYGSTYPW